jgi:hypothetical protein
MNAEESRISSTGGPQVSPPSVDRLTYMTELMRSAAGGSTDNRVTIDRVMKYAVPSGENVTHGSVPRASMPPRHAETPGIATCCHAPLWKTLA